MNVSYTAPADNRALLLLIILSGRQVLKNYYDYHWVSESVMSLLQSWNILANSSRTENTISSTRRSREKYGQNSWKKESD